MVSVPGGGAAAPLSTAAGCVRQAPAGVSALDASGRLCPCPEVPPAARGERRGLRGISPDRAAGFNHVMLIQCVCFYSRGSLH